MIFRIAQVADLEQLARMRWDHWLEGGKDPAKQDKEAFVRHVSETFVTRLNADWFIWCAVDDDEILGHVYVQQVHKVPKPSAPEDSFGYVSNVYTRPQYRNQGIGTQLMEHVKRWAAELDLEFLLLWPSESSIPFWNRAGFSTDDPLVYEVRPYVN